MKQSEMSSIYEVTVFKENKTYQEVVEGVGQEPIRFLRREYPKYTKFVLTGFEVDGNVLPLRLNYYR